MNIIIMGAGEIGHHLAAQLSTQAHDISVIETSERVAADLSEKLDARALHGTGTSVSTLEEANVAECQLFLALTSDDSSNLVAASVAKELGAKRTIARVHPAVQRDEWLFNYRAHFGIDYIFSSERLTAVELAKFIRNPNALFVEELARGRIELQQVQVSSRSRTAGKKLSELNFPPRVRIGSIQRGDKTFIPSADDSLQPHDMLTIFGEPRKVAEVVPLLQAAPPAAESEANVVIFGGTEYALALAQMLEAGNFRVRIFEQDPKLCRNLTQFLQKTVIINADATSLPQLREEQVGDADFFVAVTNQDEDNVMTCLQANNLGTKRCLALIHRADYADAISRLGARIGIFGAVSPREATRNDLLRFITEEEHQVVLRLEDGSEVVTAEIKSGSAIAGKKVSDIEWPGGSGLMALLHDQHATVPMADDVLEPGDTIYAICAPNAKNALIRLLI